MLRENRLVYAMMRIWRRSESILLAVALPLIHDRIVSFHIADTSIDMSYSKRPKFLSLLHKGLLGPLTPLK